MKFILFSLFLVGCLSEADIHKLYLSKDVFAKKIGVENLTCETEASYPYLQCSGTLAKKPVNFVCYSNGNCHWNNPRF